MGGTTPKQYLLLGQKPLALHSLDVFVSCPHVAEIIVVCEPSYHHFFSHYEVKFALPGFRRQDSVTNGFDLSSCEWICVHDAARPFIDQAMLTRLFFEGKKVGAATVGMPLKYTVKLAKEGNFVDQTLNRDQIWEIQTPQFLHRRILLEGVRIAREKNSTVTDDVSFAELAGHPAKLVEGSYANLKVTSPDDFIVAKHLLASL